MFAYCYYVEVGWGQHYIKGLIPTARMGKMIDFVILEAEKLNAEEIMRKIVESLFLKRIQNNKPCIVLICGESGSGKSYSTLKLADILANMQGWDFAKYVDDCVIYTPLDYPTKMKRILEAPELKHINIVILDEARELVKSSNWQSFQNTTISDLQATSRRLRPLIIFIISQSIGDVDSRIRKTVNWLANCNRPIGHSSSMRLYYLWRDERNLDDPKLRKRGVKGYLVQNKKYVLFKPTEFQFTLPRKEIIQIYENSSFEAKNSLIKFKLNQLLKEMQKEYKGIDIRVDAAVRYYLANPMMLEKITKLGLKKLKINPDVKDMLGFSDEELKSFEKKLKDGLIKKNNQENDVVLVEPIQQGILENNKGGN